MEEEGRPMFPASHAKNRHNFEKKGESNVKDKRA
jgi:hypothetical protein